MKLHSAVFYTNNVDGIEKFYVGLGFEVNDINAFYSRLKSEDYQILKPLTEEKWATEFTILDPDGNKVLFRSK